MPGKKLDTLKIGLATRWLALACAAGCIAASHAAAQCDPQQGDKLLASDGVRFDRFGEAVSVSGETVIVGAYATRGGGTAYIFERSGGVWSETATLIPADREQWDHFGHAVCLSGDVAIIGAWGDDDRGEDAGSAYVFERVGGSWTEVTKLIGSDVAEGDMFGISVGVAGELIVIGAEEDDDLGDGAGAAYVFERVGGIWTEVAKLTATDGKPDQVFGYSVVADGELILVGALWDSERAIRAGAVYTFERAAGAWSETGKLMASDGAEGDFFGASLAIGDESLVIGASADDDYTGSAYIFDRVGGQWVEAAKLVARDRAPRDRFGNAVAFVHEAVIVGASEVDDGRGVDAGAAYLFEQAGGRWTEAAKVIAPDGGSEDYFGYALAADGGVVAIGAQGHQSYAGATYTFDVACECYADCDRDGEVTFGDFLCFQDQFTAGGPHADCDRDGLLSFFDFLCFQNEFVSGCP